MRPARPMLPVAVLVALAFVVAACSGSDAGSGSTPAASGAGPATTRPPAPPPVYPLTGMPVTDPATAQRPALVVKIDNVNDLARPQAGINEADIVYEEKIEGPVSRFAAVFHSQDPAELGPVRSGRSTDVAIVSTLNRPLYAFSGANSAFLAQLRAAPLIDIGYDTNPSNYDRKPGRAAPDNVFTSTARLRALTPAGSSAPSGQLVYRSVGAALPTGAVPVSRVEYDFGRGPIGQPVVFTWDAGRKGWTRTQKGTPHVDLAGKQVAPTNVIVQLVPYRDTGFVDLSNTPVPEAELVGTGDAWVLTEGHAIKARWTKANNTAVTSYRTADGAAVPVTPGSTWIALVPVDGNVALTRADGSPLA